MSDLDSQYKSLVKHDFSKGGIPPKSYLNRVGKMLTGISAQNGIRATSSPTGIKFYGSNQGNGVPFYFNFKVSKSSTLGSVDVAAGNWWVNSAGTGWEAFDVSGSTVALASTKYLTVELDDYAAPNAASLSTRSTLPSTDEEILTERVLAEFEFSDAEAPTKITKIIHHNLGDIFDDMPRSDSTNVILIWDDTNKRWNEITAPTTPSLLAYDATNGVRWLAIAERQRATREGAIMKSDWTRFV